MKKQIASLCILAGFLFACVESENRPDVEIGRKVFLQRWPDSADFRELDSLKKQKRPKKSSETLPLTMQLAKKAMLLPGLQKAVAEGRQVRHSRNMNNLSREDFLEKFANALEVLSNEPQNPALFRLHSVKKSGSLGPLLIFVYGKNAVAIPQVLINFHLKALNPDLNLDTLAIGQKVKLPKL